MGITEEEATNMYYAEETHAEVAQAIQGLIEQLEASSSERLNKLAKQLTAAEDAYHETFDGLTDLMHAAEVSLEHEANACKHCGK